MYLLEGMGKKPHGQKRATQIKGAVCQKSEYMYPEFVWIDRIRADSVRNPCLM